MSELPAWQRGRSLEELKFFSSIFAERHKRLVFGAFGLVKERDVAEGLANGQLCWGMHKKELMVAALARPLKKPLEQTDFRGKPIRLPAGVQFVRAFACRSISAGVAWLDTIRGDRRAPMGAALELFQEDGFAIEAATRAGFEPVAWKVSAGSEIKAIWIRDLLRTEVCEAPGEEDLLALGIMARGFLSAEELELIRGELRIYEAKEAEAWAQHYSSYNKRKSWTAFALKGFDPKDPAFIIKPAEMSKAWKLENERRLEASCALTSIAGRFPATLRLLSRIPGEKERIRFMRLEPGGGELTRHADITDRAAGTQPGQVSRLHIPIYTNEAVRFCAWNLEGHHVERCFPEGALCYLDQRKPHTVRNDGAAARVHLVVDCIVNERLQGWLKRAARGLAPAELAA